MPDETPPESSSETAPPSEAERIAHDVQSGVETAGQIAEGVGQAAEQVQGFIEGGGGSPTVPGALQGASGAVGGAGQLLGALGVNDSLVSASLGIAQQALSLAGTAYTAVEQVVEAVESIMNAEARIEEVRFEFEVLDQPRNWEIHDLEINESLTGIYVARLELCTEDMSSDPNALLGQSVSLTMSRKELVHPIRGVVRRVEHGLSTDRAVIARVEIVPAVAMLGYGQNTRIFQMLTVPEILDEVLGVGLHDYDRTFEARLGGREYPPREYCTQRDESDWHFALRLMQEEGIACFFEHTGKREVLILADANDVYETVQTLDSRDIRFIPSENVFDAIEPIRDLVEAQQLTTTTVTVNDHDWSRVAQTFKAVDDEVHHGNREHYASSQPFTAYDWEPAQIRFRRDDRVDQARIRAEMMRRDRQVVRGRGVVSGMSPGLCFRLKGHPNGSLNQEYLLTDVQHSARNHAVAHLFDGDQARPYENTFVAMPRSRPYRPERTLKRPRIAGMESAIVVGPTKESEIHTEDFRRVQVQFRWDRLGEFDAFSSCYLRVMQAWAGNGFGVDFLPRVGMEVVVSYLGGDPDRPFITGCLYNQNNRPPYTAPGDDTKSVIRTRTSPDDGGKFNELRFDDKKNGEEIFIHASRDMNEVVERNHSTRVKANQTNTVNGNQTETVDKDQTLTVTGNRNQRVVGNEDLVVDHHRTRSVTLDETVNIGGGATTSIEGTETRTTVGARTVMVRGKDTEFVQNHKRTTVAQTFEIGVGTHIKAFCGANSILIDGSSIVAQADSQIRLQVGASALVIESGRILLQSAEVRLVGGTSSHVLTNGSATLHADTVTLQGPGSNTVKLEAPGVTIGGPTITCNASGLCTLIGAPITLN